MAQFGDVQTVQIRPIGNSTFLLITPDMREYLGITEKNELVLKFDKGKHGPFIGIGKAKR